MLEITNLTKKYKNAMIFDSCNVSFRDKAVSFIMGPNGAGKTTLIKCILELEGYDGSICFNSKPMSSYRSKCLTLWDDCPFYQNISGLENLVLFSEGKASASEIEKLPIKYLDHTILRRKVKTYSYGQKKKLALYLVDILKPEILIMDEISNGLDYEMMKSLKKHIKQLSENRMIILTGHQFGFYNGLVDDVFILKDKKLVLFDKDLSESDKSLEEIYDEELY